MARTKASARAEGSAAHAAQENATREVARKEIAKRSSKAEKKSALSPWVGDWDVSCLGCLCPLLEFAALDPASDVRHQISFLEHSSDSHLELLSYSVSAAKLSECSQE